MRRISSEEFQRELVQILSSLEKYNPLKVVLYGSFARGDHHALSDVDLIIIKETNRSFTDRIGDVLRLCRSKVNIEPLVYTPSELERMLKEGNDFLETALKEGIVVYEWQ